MSPSARPFIESTEEAIVLTLFDLANHLQRRGELLASAARLTTQQWLVLLQIAGDPNFPAAPRAMLGSEIALARGVSRATISVVISALRRRGLIAEKVDSSDARRRLLTITGEGAAAIAQIQPARRAANVRLLAHLGKRDRERLLRALRGCLGTLWVIQEDEHASAARARLSARAPGRRQNRSRPRR